MTRAGLRAGARSRDPTRTPGRLAVPLEPTEIALLSRPMDWTLDETLTGGEERGLLLELTRRWESLRPGEGVSLLKENRLRTVYRYREVLPGGAGEVRWILKQYRHIGALERLRHHLRRSHAEREYRALKRLHALGFRVPRALAFGLRYRAGVPVEGALVMEEIVDAEPLTNRLIEPSREGESGCPGRTSRRDLLRHVGEIVRRLHDRGVVHPDLHGANFLLPPGEGDEAVLIDLHSCCFPGWVPAWLRRRGLAKVVHSLELALAARGRELPPGDRRSLLAGYRSGRPSPRAASGETAGKEASGARSDLSRLDRRIGRLVVAMERRRLRSRSRRCVVDSTGFEVVRSAGRRVYRRRSFSGVRIERWLVESPPTVVLKRDARGWVARVPGEGRDLVVKFRRLGAAGRWRSLLGRHPLRTAWRAAHALEVRGIPAPRGLALVERRRGGMIRCAWLIRELVEGQPLDACLLERYTAGTVESGPRAVWKHELARQLGRLARRLHDSGAHPHDLSPQNVIVGGEPGETGGPRLVLVDHDDLRLRSGVSPARRLRNLVQLGNLPEGHVSTVDLLRALRAYDGGEGEYYRRTVIAELREGLLAEAWRSIQRMTRMEILGQLDTSARNPA